jgi:hypothetical protein
MAQTNQKVKRSGVMNFDEFKETLSAANPPEQLDLSLQALWQAGKGNWNAAHELVQTREGEQACDWIHAYLHRQEGDNANAAYWYNRAKKPVYQASLEEEWAEISTTLLSDTAR